MDTSASQTKTIPEMLRAMVAEDDHNALTIIAEVANLYEFSMAKYRTGSGRHWSAEDASRFLNICLMYLSIGEVEAGLAKLTGAPKIKPTN
jgi:hypothetical protein